MEDDDEKLDKIANDKVIEETQRLLKENELMKKWKKEIKENKAIQDYFLNFNPFSVHSFVELYLGKKNLAYRFADFYSKQAEEKRTRWINLAHEQLEVILQKKLFDMQCLWRANQLKITEVEICYDFEVWRENIFNCPFLESITKEEIEMYKNYMLLNPDRQEFSSYECQDYDNLVEGYKSQEDDNDYPLPDWYDFHNTRTGNSSLMLLPNKRGEAEDFYCNLYRKKNYQKTENKEFIPETRPLLSTFNEDQLNFFVETFEDAESKRNLKNYIEDDKKVDETYFETDYLVMKMEAEKEYIPIEANVDFRAALNIAYRKFCDLKIIEHLPLAHEQYLFNKEMNFGLETKNKEVDKEIRAKYLHMILEGRELNNEPRNLDF